MRDVVRLSAIVVAIELLGLGVFFAFFLGGVVAQGGRATVDMTMFGEKWIEYWAMLLLVAVTPYALFVIDSEWRSKP